MAMPMYSENFSRKTVRPQLPVYTVPWVPVRSESFAQRKRCMLIDQSKQPIQILREK